MEENQINDEIKKLRDDIGKLNDCLLTTLVALSSLMPVLKAQNELLTALSEITIRRS
jgi:hypothetical protein